jgi:hypothetical protein
MRSEAVAAGSSEERRSGGAEERRSGEPDGPETWSALCRQRFAFRP